jgi:simple sugar transport system ATP-binding protein
VAGDTVAGHDRSSLVRAMVGDDAPNVTVGRDRPPPGPERIVLAAAARGRLDPIDLSVRAGEVVGIAGVDGNGQSEIEAILAGRVAPERGSVSIDDRPVVVGAPRQRVQAAVAYIAADRYRYALVRAMGLADNLELGRSRRWRATPRRRAAEVAARLDRWDVRGPRTARAGQLSGGNAQKLVLARELDTPPDAVIAGHPTRGLDPGATATVASRVLAAADGGAAVVWIGAELDELMNVADRIVVLCTGHRPREFRRPFDRHAIGLAMAGSAVEQAR